MTMEVRPGVRTLTSEVLGGGATDAHAEICIGETCWAAGSVVWSGASGDPFGVYAGGLNPLYHPLPWRGPNIGRPGPSGPGFRPTEPAPPPPGFDTKWRLDPGRGVRQVPEYNPNYVYRSGYWAQNVLRGLMTFGKAIATAGGDVMIIMAGPAIIPGAQQDPLYGGRQRSPMQ